MALVLFSGGCDSTLVLYNLIKELPNQYIKVLSINHNQVHAIAENKLARQKIKEEFKKRELNKYLDFLEVDINNDSSTNVIAGGVVQPIIWSTIAVLYAQNQDTIYFGYHLGDDFWMYKSEFENAIYNMAKVCNKEIKIQYNLSYHRKADIIKELKDRGLYDLCWYCENPKNGEPCNECLPCVTHKTGLWQNETFFSEEILNKKREVSQIVLSDMVKASPDISYTHSNNI